jgi:Raf kinase inhibitor-like YbhB/YbcL family protein
VERSLYGSAELAGVPETIRIESRAFVDGGPIAMQHAADGERLSPPLSWRGAPPEAASLVLIVEEPDGAVRDPLIHCAAFDLSPKIEGLAEGELTSHEMAKRAAPEDARPQTKSPPPDPGCGPHVYAFQLYALDKRLDLDSPPERFKLLRALSEHALAKGMLIGTYERR